MLEMISGLPFLPLRIPEVDRKKMAKEVMSISVKHSLVVTAATQFFIKFLLQHSVKQLLLAKVFLSLQLVVQLEPGSED